MLPSARASLIVLVLSFTQTCAASPPEKPADKPVTAATPGCFAVGGGYLRARIRGAMDLNLNWKDADMLCEGGPRPSGKGIRVSIGGPVRGDGHRLRLVF